MDTNSAFSSLLGLAHNSGRVMSCSQPNESPEELEAARELYTRRREERAETDREVLVRHVLGRVVVPEPSPSPAAPSSTASERHRGAVADGGGGGELGWERAAPRERVASTVRGLSPGACYGFGERRAGEDKWAARRRRPAKTAVGQGSVGRRTWAEAL